MPVDWRSELHAGSRQADAGRIWYNSGMKTKKYMVAIAVAACALAALGAPEPKRDAKVVQAYIRKAVGEQTINDIKAREGGAAFLKAFFGDQKWMEEFAGSGPWSGNAAAALRALDLLVWNDEDEFITSTEIGRNIATALALNHGYDFDDEKLVGIMECYREWANDGTLHNSAWQLDTRQWREVVTFGQNAELGVENLRWIHDFANLPARRYSSIFGVCHYRLDNCFGDTVHGPMYYKPWSHRWNTQELRYRVGGVCGALSKFGSHSAAAHGIRAFTAGQPVHCAYMIWNLDDNRWDLGNSVTSHTGSHFGLGEMYCLAANEEQDRYYSDPKRMTAEYLRWQGKREEAMRLVGGNWQAAKEWQDELRSKSASKAEWDKYAAVVRDTFKESPYQGWMLYFPYLDALGTRDERLSAARAGFLAFRENKAKSVEPLYVDEKILDPLVKKLELTQSEIWKLLPYMLKGQVKTQSYFRQIVNWAAGKLMTNAEAAGKFLTVVGKAAEASSTELDFGGMALKASQNEDLTMWRQVYSLMDKISPQKRGKPTGKKWPASQYGGELLSKDGMLRTSTSSGYESPVSYRDALEAEERAPAKGGSTFHTEQETSPWGMVVLPGISEIAGVTVVNSGGGQNGGRQAPLRIWLSEDGKEFHQVYASGAAQAEWECKLNTPMKAKYVKVGREPDQRNEYFHLSKILVYGKKLY